MKCTADCPRCAADARVEKALGFAGAIFKEEALLEKIEEHVQGLTAESFLLKQAIVSLKLRRKWMIDEIRAVNAAAAGS